MILSQLSALLNCDGAADNGDGTYRLDFGKISRLATREEIHTATLAAQSEDVKRVESDTARSEAKQAYSELQPLIEHKDPAIALLAAIIQKHLLATLGR